jgi:hypothetical protein
LTRTEGNAGTFPSVTYDTDNFFVFSDCTLTAFGSARPIESFTLTIDNALDKERFRNNVTAQSLQPLDCKVTLEAVVPYASASDLIGTADAGAVGSLVVTDGTTTYTFDFGNLKATPEEEPDVGGREETLLTAHFESFRSGSNKQIKVTKT